MSNSFTFTPGERDRGWNKLKREAEKLKAQPSVKVGIVGEKANEKHGSIPMGALGAVHEYGSPKNGISERSFIRSTLDSEQDKITATMGKGLGSMLEGNTTAQAVLTDLGAELSKAVQARIKAGISPALKKGHRKPLLDTGRLLDAIGFEVVPNGKDLK